MLGPSTNSSQQCEVGELEKSEIKYNTLHIHVDFLGPNEIFPKQCARQKLDRTLDLAKVQKLLGLLNVPSESCTYQQT